MTSKKEIGLPCLCGHTAASLAPQLVSYNRLESFSCTRKLICSKPPSLQGPGSLSHTPCCCWSKRVGWVSAKFDGAACGAHLLSAWVGNAGIDSLDWGGHSTGPPVIASAAGFQLPHVSPAFFHGGGSQLLVSPRDGQMIRKLSY
jgi:hypothetical protein